MTHTSSKSRGSSDPHEPHDLMVLLTYMSWRWAMCNSVPNTDKCLATFRVNARRATSCCLPADKALERSVWVMNGCSKTQCHIRDICLSHFPGYYVNAQPQCTANPKSWPPGACASVKRGWSEVMRCKSSTRCPHTSYTGEQRVRYTVKSIFNISDANCC